MAVGGRHVGSWLLMAAGAAGGEGGAKKAAVRSCMTQHRCMTQRCGNASSKLQRAAAAYATLQTHTQAAQ